MAAAEGCTLYQIAAALYRTDPKTPSIIEGKGHARAVLYAASWTIIRLLPYCSLLLWHHNEQIGGVLGNAAQTLNKLSDRHPLELLDVSRCFFHIRPVKRLLGSSYSELHFNDLCCDIPGQSNPLPWLSSARHYAMRHGRAMRCGRRGEWPNTP